MRVIHKVLKRVGSKIRRHRSVAVTGIHARVGARSHQLGARPVGLVRLWRGVEDGVAGFQVPHLVASALKGVIEPVEMANLVRGCVAQVVRVRIPARKRRVQQEHAVIVVALVNLVREMRYPPQHAAPRFAGVHVEVGLRALRQRPLDDPLTGARRAVIAEERRPRCVPLRRHVHVPHGVQTERYPSVHRAIVDGPVVRRGDAAESAVENVHLRSRPLLGHPPRASLGAVPYDVEHYRYLHAEVPARVSLP